MFKAHAKVSMIAQVYIDLNRFIVFIELGVGLNHEKVSCRVQYGFKDFVSFEKNSKKDISIRS